MACPGGCVGFTLGLREQGEVALEICETVHDAISAIRYANNNISHLPPSSNHRTANFTTASDPLSYMEFIVLSPLSHNLGKHALHRAASSREGWFELAEHRP